LVVVYTTCVKIVY